MPRYRPPLEGMSRGFSCKVKKCGQDHHQLLHDYMMEKKTVAVVASRLAETSGYLGVQQVDLVESQQATVL
ncbi:MAG: hypothetical protein GY696_31170 [Gammaproteobacteria bacterium]|nr:hypothetical protein [Gammaproteobacteria bacterium]